MGACRDVTAADGEPRAVGKAQGLLPRHELQLGRRRLEAGLGEPLLDWAEAVCVPSAVVGGDLPCDLGRAPRRQAVGVFIGRSVAEPASPWEAKRVFT